MRLLRSSRGRSSRFSKEQRYGRGTAKPWPVFPRQTETLPQSSIERPAALPWSSACWPSLCCDDSRNSIPRQCRKSPQRRSFDHGAGGSWFVELSTLEHPLSARGPRSSWSASESAKMCFGSGTPAGERAIGAAHDLDVSSRDASKLARPSKSCVETGSHTGHAV